MNSKSHYRDNNFVTIKFRIKKILKALKKILISVSGFVSGSNFDGHPRNNSSKKIARNNIIQNVLKSNLNTLLEESRALEDEIYSEVYNLQKNMENKQGTNTGLKYYKNDLNLSEIKYKKNRKLENKNNLQKFTKSTNSGEHFSQNDIHNLKFANEFMNVSGDLLLNKNEYFLGFSGNPFEVHEGKYDVFELLKPE